MFLPLIFFFQGLGLVPMSHCSEDKLNSLIRPPHAGLTSSMIEYNSDLLHQHSQRKEICTLLVVGATWDGHFRVWLKNGSWERIERVLSQSKQRMRAKIELGYFLYHDQRLPKITSDAWAQPSIGSYEIVMFKDGKTLQREGVNKLLRPPRSHERYDDEELRERLEMICLEEGVVMVQDL
jgi:hypothetical protein